MAWFEILKGESVLLEGELPNLADDTLKDIKAKAKDFDLKLGVTVDSENETTAVALGVNVSPSQHFYQGQTVTLMEKPLPEGFKALFEEMCEALIQAGYKLYNHSQGIIVSRFD